MADATTALLAALDDGRVRIRDVVESIADVTDAPAADLDERSTAQFVHAFEALLREALHGASDQRELVLTAAVPALVAGGLPALDLVERQVALFAALSIAMAEAVDAEHRPQARRWLAGYAARHIREVAELGLAAERDAAGGSP